MGTRNTTRGDTNPNILPLLVLYGLALVQVGEDLPMPWKPRLLVILAAGVVLAWRAGPSPPRWMVLPPILTSVLVWTGRYVWGW